MLIDQIVLFVVMMCSNEAYALKRGTLCRRDAIESGFVDLRGWKCTDRVDDVGFGYRDASLYSMHAS